MASLVHSWTALIFCFHFKKTAVESYRLLREAYGKFVPSQDACERWFRRFKSGDFEVAGKDHGKRPKKFEDVELQALLVEDDSQAQNNSSSNWALVNKLFPIDYERWESFRRSIDGYHMS